MISVCIFFILLCYGISNIVVFSHGPFMIFEKIRTLMEKLPSNLGEVTQCMICFPTWCGLAVSAINLLLCNNCVLTPSYYLMHDASLWYLIIPFDGAIASGSVWIIHTLQECIENISASKEKEEYGE